MLITVINDCRDNNARVRQETRLAALFASLKPTISFLGVANDTEASGNLIDVLDAGLGTKGVVLVNVAPRNLEDRKYGNGTPFGYFWYKETLVISSLYSDTLSLVLKLGLVTTICELDLAETSQHLGLSEVETSQVVATQFRSYEFLPRAALVLQSRKEYSIGRLLGIDRVTSGVGPNNFWFIDCFGNIKTTALPEDIGFRDGARLEVLPGKTAICFAGGLKAVPDGQLGVVVGSSGIGSQRFIELVVSGRSAAERLHIRNTWDVAQGYLFLSGKVVKPGGSEPCTV